MCLILAIVEMVFFNDSEESLYGDQGQEVAWEVGKERFIAKREQEIEEHQVTPEICRGSQCERFAQRVFESVALGEEWSIGEYEAERGTGFHS
jgi:hypothetical protein